MGLARGRQPLVQALQELDGLLLVPLRLCHARLMIHPELFEPLHVGVLEGAKLLRRLVEPLVLLGRRGGRLRLVREAEPLERPSLHLRVRRRQRRLARVAERGDRTIEVGLVEEKRRLLEPGQVRRACPLVLGLDVLVLGERGVPALRRGLEDGAGIFDLGLVVVLRRIADPSFFVVYRLRDFRGRRRFHSLRPPEVRGSTGDGDQRDRARGGDAFLIGAEPPAERSGASEYLGVGRVGDPLGRCFAPNLLETLRSSSFQSALLPLPPSGFCAAFGELDLFFASEPLDLVVTTERRDALRDRLGRHGVLALPCRFRLFGCRGLLGRFVRHGSGLLREKARVRAAGTVVRYAGPSIAPSIARAEAVRVSSTEGPLRDCGSRGRKRMPSVFDPMFALPARTPFRWGTSPFHARGVLYNEELAVAQKVLGGKVFESVHQAGDKTLEAFLTQRFSTFEWYDTLPLVFLGVIVARTRGVPLSQHIRDVAEAHAARALTGFSGTVLRLVSTEAVATWLPRASAWYHDFGAGDAKVVGERHVRGLRRGMPLSLVQGWSISATHFVETVLLKSGAREPRAHTLGAEPDGSRDGHPLYQITFDITWAG